MGRTPSHGNPASDMQFTSSKARYNEKNRHESITG